MKINYSIYVSIKIKGIVISANENIAEKISFSISLLFSLENITFFRLKNSVTKYTKNIMVIPSKIIAAVFLYIFSANGI